MESAKASRAAILAPLILSGLALFATPAFAAESDELGDFRVGGFAGAFVPNKQNWSGSGTLNGLPFNGTGKMTLNNGWAIGGLLGYSFRKTPGWEWLNIDLELGHVATSFQKFDGNVNIAGLGSLNGPFPLDGQLHTEAGFVNILATPFGQRVLWDNRLTPFIGIGPGLAHSTAKVRSFSLGPATLPINSTSTETDFAFDAAIGTDIAILPQSVPELELGISYEYTWIDTKHLGGGSGIQANTGAASGNIFGVVLEYRFGAGKTL
jgi:Outer membrane protein beta-barrel domain